LFLILSFGFWNLKKWAFWLGLFIFGIATIIPLLFWTIWTPIVIVAIVPAIMLIYLISQKEEF
jgi:hypothetical protein